MSVSKQVLYQPVDIDDADFVNIEADPHAEAENAEFDAFKAEMHDSQDDAKLTVSKRMTDARGRPLGQQAFECFECGIEDYTFSQLCTRIREDFGSGLYKVQGRDSKGKFKFRKMVGIQAPIDPDVNVNESNPANLIASMSRAMSEQQDRFERLMLNAPQNQQVDPIDQMTKMMTAMGAMMGAMGINQQPAIPPKTPLESMLEMKLMKDAAGELLGGADGSGSTDNVYGLLAEVAKSFGAPLMQAISMAQQTGAIDQAGVIQLPAPEPEVIPTNPTTEPDATSDDANMNLKQMRDQLDFLIIQAKNNVEYSIVVEFIIDSLPDTNAAYDKFEEFLENENCIDRCAMVNSEVNNHREWFLGWRQAMLAKLADMIDDPNDSAQPKSDAGDAPVAHTTSVDELKTNASEPINGDTRDADGTAGRIGGNIPDTDDNESTGKAVQEKPGDKGTQP